MALVEFEFDPFDWVGADKSELPKEAVKEALAEVSDYLLESILSDVGDQLSPVTGRKFKALDPEYLKRKKEEGGSPIANLELHGDLMDSVRVKPKSERIYVTVEGEKEQLKADNHNKFSPESKKTPLPARKFIPNAKEGETFRNAIRLGIQEIIDEYLEEYGTQAQSRRSAG